MSALNFYTFIYNWWSSLESINQSWPYKIYPFHQIEWVAKFSERLNEEYLMSRDKEKVYAPKLAQLDLKLRCCLPKEATFNKSTFPFVEILSPTCLAYHATHWHFVHRKFAKMCKKDARVKCAIALSKSFSRPLASYLDPFEVDCIHKGALKIFHPCMLSFE